MYHNPYWTSARQTNWLYRVRKQGCRFRLQRFLVLVGPTIYAKVFSSRKKTSGNELHSMLKLIYRHPENGASLPDSHFFFGSCCAAVNVTRSVGSSENTIELLPIQLEWVGAKPFLHVRRVKHRANADWITYQKPFRTITLVFCVLTFCMFWHSVGSKLVNITGWPFICQFKSPASSFSAKAGFFLL